MAVPARPGRRLDLGRARRYNAPAARRFSSRVRETGSLAANAWKSTAGFFQGSEKTGAARSKAWKNFREIFQPLGKVLVWFSNLWK